MGYYAKTFYPARTRDPENANPRLAGVLSGSRYYNPSLGRWISRDPIGEPGGHDIYAFINNAPPSDVDPYGQATWQEVVVGVVVVAIVAEYIADAIKEMGKLSMQREGIREVIALRIASTGVTRGSVPMKVVQYYGVRWPLAGKSSVRFETTLYYRVVCIRGQPKLRVIYTLRDGTNELMYFDGTGLGP